MEVYIKHRLPPDARSRDFEYSGEHAVNDKIAWSGAVTAVQPRIRLTRSFDERSHTYLGYLLRIEGTSVENLPNFESVSAPAPTRNINFESATTSRGWGIGSRIRDSKLPTSIKSAD